MSALITQLAPMTRLNKVNPFRTVPIKNLVSGEAVLNVVDVCC